MRHFGLPTAILLTLLTHLTSASPSQPPTTPNITLNLFADLEELSRIVDISYCVGTTGIQKPFLCASRCDDFPAFELVDTFNTGPLMSDSCGYIVLDHGKGRVIVAFRGTYSIANTIVDLSTVPQEYVPYPGEPENGVGDALMKGRRKGFWGKVSGLWRSKVEGDEKEVINCENCTVHSGFWTSWQNTRPFILPHLKEVRQQYPGYKLYLVGHSLGGAVAALASLELDALGWQPIVTTFGEPKVGNAGLRKFLDRRFELPYGNNSVATLGQNSRYRRITHVDDPVPLLPLHEWGYRPHAGEVFITKASLQPSLSDLRSCYGDEDSECSAGAEVDESWFNGIFFSSTDPLTESEMDIGIDKSQEEELQKLSKRWGIPIPSRYKMWQLFFAHRDYFWRLGLCVSGGDPADWGRDKYRFGEGGDNRDDVVVVKESEKEELK